ncbi:helix-turn-helix domain-containing protein [Rhizobium azibense]|uniref:Helix-turn-helix protein n=1 Tax=Rhizobium azibense TaxID=1136135 RepID=A0A4R3RI58_9HYPH|nr:helix-turn-helix transcriptional regulator [Rhizobium azibense]TCU34059.1 helix-turn-helix protein [Rhizobium azibense]
MAPIAKPKYQLQKTFLREWRRISGISQKDAAVELNISRPLLSQIENAKSPYTQRLIERAAQVYGCTPTEILRGPKHPIDIDLLFRTIVVIEESILRNGLAKKTTSIQKAHSIIELFKLASNNDNRPPTPEEADELLKRSVE